MILKTPKKVITPEEYMDHFQAIGGLCYQWALLDSALTYLIEYLSELEEKTTACLLSASRDTSQKCEIARRLSVLKVPHGPWRDCLLNTLSVIQNKMCDLRNRTVHDEWELGESQITRITRSVKMPLNSEQVREIVYESKTPVELGEIDKLVEDVSTIMIGVVIMASQFRKERAKLQTLKAPEPLLLLYKRYFPKPTRKSGPKPKPPKKSSPK
jgi:hypothetical protein